MNQEDAKQAGPSDAAVSPGCGIPDQPQAILSTMTGFSRAMEIALTLVLIALPIGLGVFAFGFSEKLGSQEMLPGLNSTGEPLPLEWRFAALAVLLAGALPLLYAANAARLMFAGFRRAEVFTAHTAWRLKQIALGLLAQAVVSTIGGVALSAVLSGAGTAKGLAVVISSDQILTALFAFIFLGIARVMRAAALIAEDNAAIV